MWSTEIDENVYNLYPLYDWKNGGYMGSQRQVSVGTTISYMTSTIAGVSLDRQRVASPFINEAIESLALYKVIDPDTWGR